MAATKKKGEEGENVSRSKKTASAKSKRPESVLMIDAGGRLYAVPTELIAEFALSDKEAKRLISSMSKGLQPLTAALKDSGIVKRIGGEELPNFRLLMQLEYRAMPTPV